MSVRSIEVLQQFLRRLCDEAVPPEDVVAVGRASALRAFFCSKAGCPFAMNRDRGPGRVLKSK
jgi:hypothetical protein